jgi:hypothetical protein
MVRAMFSAAEGSNRWTSEIRNGACLEVRGTQAHGDQTFGDVAVGTDLSGTGAADHRPAPAGPDRRTQALEIIASMAEEHRQRCPRGVDLTSHLGHGLDGVWVFWTLRDEPSLGTWGLPNGVPVRPIGSTGMSSRYRKRGGTGVPPRAGVNHRSVGSGSHDLRPDAVVASLEAVGKTGRGSRDCPGSPGHRRCTNPHRTLRESQPMRKRKVTIWPEKSARSTSVWTQPPLSPLQPSLPGSGLLKLVLKVSL